MLERLTDLPDAIDGLRAIGKVSREDYARVVQPMIDDARRQNRRLRLLYQFGPEFDGFTPGGAWEDVKASLRTLRIVDGCAVVSDIPWIRESARMIGFLLPCPVRLFANAQRDEAARWLSSLPQGASIVYRMLHDAGVIVVEIAQALRAEDFDALALAADSWIEANGRLPGLVIHAREFPGWQNLGSVIRHVRFVSNHHRVIQRIALAADSTLATLMPHVAQHFVRAEVKVFPYDALDAAIRWASASPGASSVVGASPPL